MKRLLLLVGCLLLATLSVRATDFNLGVFGTLTITVADGWTITSKALADRDGKPISYTLVMTPPEAVNAKGLTSLLFHVKGPHAKDDIRQKVQSLGETLLPQAVEKEVVLHDFALAQGFGSYSIMTDPKLVGKPPVRADYKAVANGVIQPTDQIQGIVSLMTDDVNGEDFKAMLAMINSLTITPPAAETPAVETPAATP